LVHAFCVGHEEQVGQELILVAYQVYQPMAVAQQQFAYEHHED
jgi:hypothetical protein